jgi:hypothetical protein
MKINRRSVAAGLAAGVLAGGAVDAIAATTSRSRTARTLSTTTSKTPSGWDRHRPGWSGDRTPWRNPGGSYWGERHSESTNPMTSDRW